MLMPVRCFSCGFPVSEYYEAYKESIAKGKTPEEALNSLDIKNYCCRRMLLTSVDYITELIKFQK